MSKMRWATAAVALAALAAMAWSRTLGESSSPSPIEPGKGHAPSVGAADSSVADGRSGDAAPTIARPVLVASGAKLYAQFCVACHGPLPGGAQTMGPTLHASEYLAFATDRRIDSLIVHGVPGTAMLGWSKRRGGMLEDEQVQGLVAYVRSLQPSAPSVPTWRNGRKGRLP